MKKKIARGEIEKIYQTEFRFDLTSVLKKKYFDEQVVFHVNCIKNFGKDKFT